MLRLSKRHGSPHYQITGTVTFNGQSVRVRRSAHTADRVAATAAATALQREIMNELAGLSGKPTTTFAEAAAAYANANPQLHANDLAKLISLVDCLGDEPLPLAPSKAIESIRRCAAPGAKHTTLNRWRGTLYAAINFAHEVEGAQRSNPCPTFRGAVGKSKLASERIRYLSDGERDRLISSYSPWLWPLAETLAFQGCRVGEALRLTWADVSAACDEVRFREISGRPRTAPSHPRVQAALASIRPKGPGLGPVFLNRHGQPFRDYSKSSGVPIARQHQTACRRAGIEDFRIHDWRHHWASSMVMAGVDLRTIQELGGWASMRMLERYAHLTSQHLRASIERI